MNGQWWLIRVYGKKMCSVKCAEFLIVKSVIYGIYNCDVISLRIYSYVYPSLQKYTSSPTHHRTEERPNPKSCCRKEPAHSRERLEVATVTYDLLQLTAWHHANDGHMPTFPMFTKLDLPTSIPWQPPSTASWPHRSPLDLALPCNTIPLCSPTKQYFFALPHPEPSSSLTTGPPPLPKSTTSPHSLPLRPSLSLKIYSMCVIHNYVQPHTSTFCFNESALHSGRRHINKTLQYLPQCRVRKSRAQSLCSTHP